MARTRRALDVWLYGHHVATLTEPRPFRYRLEWTVAALDRFGTGARPLSLSLPVGTRPITDGDHRPVSAFLEGLLPEGNLRRHLAAIYNVTAIDKMGLLAHIGQECAGAIQFLPRGEVPGAGIVRPLTSLEVDRLIADLPTYHPPEGSHLQASLAGLQDKVLLTAMPGGGWGWPEGGAASTHIVKPEPLTDAVVPHLIESEDWALRLADAAGMPAAQSRLATFDGRAAIVVTRDGPCEVRTGHDRTGDRRYVELDGRRLRGTAGLSGLGGILWLVPAQDRLFQDGPAGRRRFLDRLVLLIDPDHAGRVQHYERTVRERSILLRPGLSLIHISEPTRPY